MESLFYETVNDEDKNIIVAVIREDSEIENFQDLKNAKVCFPTYGGVAWYSTIDVLQSGNLLTKCPWDRGMEDFFSGGCTPDFPGESHLKKNCRKEYRGDFGALDCLRDRAGDVAFVPSNTLASYIKGALEYPHSPRTNRNIFTERKVEGNLFGKICPDGITSSECHLSWTPIGEGMISSNKSDVWKKDALDTFLQLDVLFGKNYKSITRAASLFDSFNGNRDVLFHDATLKLRNTPTARNSDNMSRQYGKILDKLDNCVPSGASRFFFPKFLMALALAQFLIR